jgi:signal transduction histidine kinase
VGLRFRLVLLLLVPMILVVAGYALIRVSEEREQRRAEFARRVNVTGAAIRLAVVHALRSDSLADVDRLARDLVVKQTEIVRIRLMDVGLAPKVDANLMTGDPGVAVERFRQVRDTGESQVVEHQSQRIRLYSVLLPLRPLLDDSGVLEVAFVASRLEADLLHENRRSVLSGTILILLLGLVVWFALQRLVFRPVADLTQGLERVAAGEAGATVPIRREDELGRVAEAFNRMTARLEESRRQVESESDRSLDLMRRLRQTENLAVAGKLCSSMAHEVGTPLNIIAGRAELMLRALPEDSPLREDLGVVISQIDRISKMIRTALDPFHRREAQQTATQLTALTEGLRPLIQHFARTHGVKLAIAIPAGLPPVLVDSGHLQQVLINLLTNAIEATPAGGHVEVSAAGQPENGHSGVVVAVRDTGAGIPPDVLPRIFDPFFSTKPAHAGTGLGLSICRDLIRSNGSDIKVASTPGHGTTFTVWLPEAGPDAEKEQS